MKIISDYHMHTKLCGHADGEPAQYVERALALGLTEIGFSDHAPLVSHRDPGITMDHSELPQYHQMIENIRAQYKGKIKIRTGIEADFLPGFETQTQALLGSYPYDYVIGSIHFIKRWGFDDPIQRQEWDNKDIDEVYREYYELLRQSAASGLFDVMGHVDVVKKFGHKPSQPMIDDVKRTAQTFKKAGVAIELNTSGLRKPVKEMYPSLWSLEIYAAAGVPLTFGSDAHKPEEVGADFDQARDLALKAGYKKYVIFQNRKIFKQNSL
ncbi:MAG: histidinol-phosphatase HisJ [Candidatus Omnitrophica bacterium]|nr:histidinol-phosphatase HisJ [Candidatus Omnitrophota bacterium]